MKGQPMRVHPLPQPRIAGAGMYGALLLDEQALCQSNLVQRDYLLRKRLAISLRSLEP